MIWFLLVLGLFSVSGASSESFTNASEMFVEEFFKDDRVATIVSLDIEWDPGDTVGAFAEPPRESIVEDEMKLIVEDMPSLSGYSNGFLPDRVLCEISFAPGYVAYCPMVEALELLNEDFVSDLGFDLPIVSAYRSYDYQAGLYVNDGGTGFVAPPGYSLHGASCAIDVGDGSGGFLDWDSPTKVWLDENGYKYGLMQKRWQASGSATPEPWHYEFFTVQGEGDLELITKKPTLDVVVDLPV